MDSVIVIDGAPNVLSPGEAEEVTVVTQAEQGPPGADGASSQRTAYTAGVALGGHRVVYLDANNTLQYVDNGDPSTLQVVGLTLGAAVEGASCLVQESGLVTEPSWSWVLGAPVFLGANGLLTQTPPVYPSALYSLVVGLPSTPTSLYVRFREPLALGE